MPGTPSLPAVFMAVPAIQAPARLKCKGLEQRDLLSAAGVKQADASMAVLVMEMLAPAASFVLHTASPLDRDTSTLHAEVGPPRTVRFQVKLGSCNR